MEKDNVARYDSVIHSHISEIPINGGEISDSIATVTSFAKTDKSLVRCQIGHTHFMAH